MSTELERGLKSEWKMVSFQGLQPHRRSWGRAEDVSEGDALGAGQGDVSVYAEDVATTVVVIIASFDLRLPESLG